MYQIAILDVVNAKLPTMRDDSGVWISVKELSEGMGLASPSQILKLKADPRYKLSEKVFETNGGEQKKICISINQLPAYLYSINPNKVKASSKEFVLKFQAQTFEVINSYWLGEQLPHAETNPEIEKYKNTILAQNACIAKLYNELQAKPKQLPHANKEVEDLKQTLVKLHDGYHRILTTCSPLTMIDELRKMTNLFQTIGSTNGDGRNLNTQTQAKHRYWREDVQQLLTH